MWPPRTADALVAAIETLALPNESASFEVKKQLPAPKANHDIAVDVAAMAITGAFMICNWIPGRDGLSSLE